MQQPDKPDETEVLSGQADADEHNHSGLSTPWRRRSPRARAVIAATGVAVLALSGTVAYAAASGDSGGPPSASPHSSSQGPGERHGHGGRWFGSGGDAAHGEATVKDPDTGDWVVRVWQRGTVQKADADRITVRSEDGASWTWKLGPGATASPHGSPGAAAPKTGDTVSVVGSRSGDAYTADRVLSGSPGEHRRDDRHGGFPGHGPWGRGGDDRSPGPVDRGTAN
ncbi:hypothetical protein C6376_38630 [Streptomyces sp. P3]|uniref:hypothetical protein n=1 Tax=Streptomyces sp. P3 TaxID=2135430 RepID=UPI000D1A6AD7|nr:hypothetical protein [Streptomyces sp. P3]AVV46393.1 hypothetical protein C6376_38630 [Streptomyces sp. P3]